MEGFWGSLAILWVLMAWLSAACFTATVAKAKGYDTASWFFGGLLFGLIALITAAGMPGRAPAETGNPTASEGKS